ncbi:MAG: sensor histidine kinase [Actinobacteria bacterium]|nr:sensor histidine kinase [Actinomycetota bacterium]MCA0296824.1 sensor histidine kinase [Actinomycetota bacterium]
MGTTWQRLRQFDRRSPWVFDGGLVAVLLIAALISGATSSGPLPLGWRLALLAAAALPYAWLRRRPLVTLVTGSIPVVALLALGEGTAVIGAALFLAAYAVAAGCPGRIAALGAGYCALVLVAIAALAPDRFGWGVAVTNLALFAGAFGLGRAARSRTRAVGLLAERVVEAERARATAAESAVTAERLRIARELHDVVGHSLGAIALQAGVGARVVETDPAEARAALQAIAERSRASLQDVRRILGALRDPAEDLGGSPGLAELDGLVGGLAAAGLTVTVSRTGQSWPLPPAMDLTAYRLLQESLTNVLRHSAARTARVEIAYAPELVRLSVRDVGPASSAEPVGDGHGQLGMRERVAVWNGSLRLGPLPGGGYEVVAELPRGQEE